MHVANVRIRGRVQRAIHKRMVTCCSTSGDEKAWSEGVYAGALHHIRYPITETVRNLITVPVRRAIEDDLRP